MNSLTNPPGLETLHPCGVANLLHRGDILQHVSIEPPRHGLVCRATNAACSYFPSLTKTLGFDNTKTLLMSAPPWVVRCISQLHLPSNALRVPAESLQFACIVALANTWHSDRSNERYFHMAWPLGLGIIGFIMAIATEPTNVGARYTSLFFMTSSYAGYILVSSSSYLYLSPHARLTRQDLLMDGVQFPQASRKARCRDFVRERHLPTGLSRRLGECSLEGVDWPSSCSSGQYVWPSSYGPSFRRSFIFVAVMYAAVIIVS